MVLVSLVFSFAFSDSYSDFKNKKKPFSLEEYKANYISKIDIKISQRPNDKFFKAKLTGVKKCIKKAKYKKNVEICIPYNLRKNKKVDPHNDFLKHLKTF
jgi:hypothetical protein